jgi:antitoxin ParD1/3/4
MSQLSKLSIALTPEMNDLIHQAVDSGEYASTSEVVTEALLDWKQQRTLKQFDDDELRRLWAEGIASGPGRLGTMAAIKQEARRRLETSTSDKD